MLASQKTRRPFGCSYALDGFASTCNQYTHKHTHTYTHTHTHAHTHTHTHTLSVSCYMYQHVRMFVLSGLTEHFVPRTMPLLLFVYTSFAVCMCVTHTRHHEKSLRRAIRGPYPRHRNLITAIASTSKPYSLGTVQTANPNDTRKQPRIRNLGTSVCQCPVFHEPCPP